MAGLGRSMPKRNSALWALGKRDDCHSKTHYTEPCLQLSNWHAEYARSILRVPDVYGTRQGDTRVQLVGIYHCKLRLLGDYSFRIDGAYTFGARCTIVDGLSSVCIATTMTAPTTGGSG